MDTDLPDSRRDQQPSHQRTRYPSLLQAVGLLLGAMLLQGVVGLAASFVAAEDDGGLPRDPLLWGLVNVLALGPIIYYGWSRASAEGTSFSFNPVRWPTLLPMVLLLIGLSIFISEIDNLTQSVIGPPPAVLDLSWMFIGEDRSPLGVVFLLVVVAPVTEELLFRGVILPGLLSRHSSAMAVILSALLFALFHLNPWQFVGAFMLGVLFGWWYVKLGSLTPCLFGHAVVNGFPVVVSAAFPPIPGFSEAMAGTAQLQPVWLDGVGLLLVLVGGIWLWRELARQEPAALVPAVAAGSDARGPSGADGLGE